MIAKKQAWLVFIFPFPLIRGNQQSAKTVQKKGKRNGVTLGEEVRVSIQKDITYWSKDINRGFNNDEDRNSN